MYKIKKCGDFCRQREIKVFFQRTYIYCQAYVPFLPPLQWSLDIHSKSFSQKISSSFILLKDTFQHNLQWDEKEKEMDIKETYILLTFSPLIF